MYIKINKGSNPISSEAAKLWEHIEEARFFEESTVMDELKLSEQALHAALAELEDRGIATFTISRSVPEPVSDRAVSTGVEAFGSMVPEGMPWV